MFLTKLMLLRKTTMIIGFGAEKLMNKKNQKKDTIEIINTQSKQMSTKNLSYWLRENPY